jgi:hypothetical protein
MASSFNPFDNLTSFAPASISSPKKATLAANALRQREKARAARQHDVPTGAGLDLSFFDTPEKKSKPLGAKKFTFSDMHATLDAEEGSGGFDGGFDGGDDDWSDFEETQQAQYAQQAQHAQHAQQALPQMQHVVQRKKKSSLSPRVLALARKSSVRRALESSLSPRLRQPLFGEGSGGPPPPPVPSKQQPAPPSKPPRLQMSRQSRADSEGDRGKTNKLLAILNKLTKYTGRKSSQASQILTLAYEELALFIQNPQYRDAAAAVDGLLEVYTAIKRIEHDFGAMDPRMIRAYESLKKLAVQLGAQQAEIFARAEAICEGIRQEDGPVTSAMSNKDRPVTPSKSHVASVERRYGLSSDGVQQMLRPFARDADGAGAAELHAGQVSGPLLLRRGTLMKKWVPVYFCLTNGRLAVYRSRAAVREGSPIVDVRVHGKMRMAGYKTYPQKGGPPVMALKFQELDQTLGLSGPQGAKWETLFKFGATKGATFELWKAAINAVITFNRKKDPKLAMKRSFSFGLV